MTEKREITPTAPLSSGSLALLLMSSLTFFLILFGANEAVGAMKRALSLCAETIIPSLFPFMVASELIVHSGVAECLGRRFSPLFRTLFGISGAGGSALLLGTLCGFPIGAKSASSLYESSKISRGELRRLLCICNQPSSAFVTSAVGLSLFGSQRFGILLYGITLLSGLIIGLICRFLPFHDETYAPLQHTEDSTPKGVSCFPDAVSHAAQAMLTVCAFVCFFSALVACLESLPTRQHLPAPLSALLVGFFELTGGVARAAACPSPFLASCLVAWCLGWSGLSVHFQIMTLCRRCDVSFRPYFVAKAAQGILSAMLLALILRLFPAWMPLPNPQEPVSLSRRAWPLWLALFVSALVLATARWGKKRVIYDKIRQKTYKKRGFK